MNKEIYWCEKSAEQGHKHAQYELALIHEIVKNINKAIYWYEKSAEQGHKAAQI